MAQRFRTREVEIEATQFTGRNWDEMAEWTENSFHEVDPEDRLDDPDITAEVYDKLHSTWIGVIPGQWIVRGVKGEYYPCDNETFFWKYEEIS